MDRNKDTDVRAFLQQHLHCSLRTGKRLVFSCLDNTPHSANPTIILTRNISLQVREYVNPGGRFLWSEFSDVYSCFMLHKILNSCRQKHVIAKDYEEKAKWLGKFS